MSLRWRWALSITAVGTLAVVATAAIGLLTTSRELRAQVDRDLVTRFELASRVVPATPLRRPFDTTRQPFEVAPEGDFDSRDLVDLDAVIQVTVAGIVVVPGDPELPVRSHRELAEGPRLETVDIDGRSYRMISGQVEHRRLERLPRVVQLAIAVEDIDDAIALLFRRLAVIGSGLTVVAGAVGWILARTAVRPIEDLTAVTDGLAASIDRNDPLPVDAPGEVGRLAASFDRMLTSLRASREQQRRLIADAGHEFRTPLTALRTNVETLLRRGPELTEDQRRELLTAALAESSELAELATELVDLASDAALRDEPHLPVDLADLAETVARRYVQRSGLAIGVTGVASPVEGRWSDLERALSNLIDNAVKWSPADESIEIHLDGSTVSVRDRGPGIPEHDIPHVFERFHRSLEARSTPGSGLGLAIVEHVVTAHGGRVFARNRDDGGAEVGFTLDRFS
ncbi:MAG TPA: HAMP domain-containing sensor histidine kinase [Acidimicrobiia bacterium]|nr:HAMP domain-containing sensor histidine kinase [Acidimicrobiia bacterium]